MVMMMMSIRSACARGATTAAFPLGGGCSLPLAARSASSAATTSEAGVKDVYAGNVMATYGRFDIVLEKGEGNHVWDEQGKRYLDMGGGIAVNCLGHSHPAIVDTVQTQITKLLHVSNLYYTEQQGELARRLNGLMGGGGRTFFCNSGAEANEGMYKLARKHGDGRYEIITAQNSFHGRTLAGIAATGQDKIKNGFHPMMPGFSHVPFNDLAALEKSITDKTAAVMIEGVQGEGGILPATPEYLAGIRKLCDAHGILMLMDGVQCGHFRTGRFQSFQSIMEGAGDVVPDAMSMAKSLGGGFPMGAMWCSEELRDVLSAGTHGTTYGGGPLGCAIANAILDVVEEEDLQGNVRSANASIVRRFAKLHETYPGIIKDGSPRGMGLMLGIELESGIGAFSSSEASPALQLVGRLHDAGVLTVPSGDSVVRLLPALNIDEEAIEECFAAFDKVFSDM